MKQTDRQTDRHRQREGRKKGKERERETNQPLTSFFRSTRAAYYINITTYMTGSGVAGSCSGINIYAKKGRNTSSTWSISYLFRESGGKQLSNSWRYLFNNDSQPVTHISTLFFSCFFFKCKLMGPQSCQNKLIGTPYVLFCFFYCL